MLERLWQLELVLLPEPAVVRVLEWILYGTGAGICNGAAHFKLTRLTCRYVRGVSCCVDVSLQSGHAGIRAARAVFPRSTSVAVTSVPGTSDHEVGFVLAVDSASLSGIRHVRLHTAGCPDSGTAAGREIVVPALDAARLVVASHGRNHSTRVVFARSPNLRDLELRSTTLDARVVGSIAGACELHSLRVSLSRVTLCAFGALGAISLTALDVSGFRTIPKLEIPTLERLRARLTSMHPGALVALGRLTYLDARGALVVDYAGARRHRLAYLDVGDAGLPWADRGSAPNGPIGPDPTNWANGLNGFERIDVCLADGAHWRLGPCARYEVAPAHVPLVTTLSVDRASSRAMSRPF
jgi:hypothetical protein